jgi:hypothetical protein
LAPKEKGQDETLAVPHSQEYDGILGHGRTTAELYDRGMEVPFSLLLSNILTTLPREQVMVAVTTKPGCCMV